MDRSKEANGLRCAEPEGDGLGSEVLGWLGSNAPGSEALSGKALARRPLVRKVIARERSLPACREILAGVELVSEVLGSEAPARKELTIVQGIHGSIQRHVVRLPYLGWQAQ